MAYMPQALPRSRSCAAHLTAAACRRAAERAGNRIEISSAIMPMTTSSSTRVKPLRTRRGAEFMVRTPGGARDKPVLVPRVRRAAATAERVSVDEYYVVRAQKVAASLRRIGAGVMRAADCPGTSWAGTER